MATNPWEIYDLLIERAHAVLNESDKPEPKIRQVIIGLTWTLCLNDADGIGLCMSPGQYTRTLPWSGTLVGRPLKEMFSWVKSWNPFEAAVGLAAINSVINPNALGVTAQAVPIHGSGAQNLAVFDFFLPRLKNKKVAVVGRYPGLEQYESTVNLTVLERAPQGYDYPDPACEYILRDMDWVFLTANSIANKTFTRLAELCRDSVTVLMGPSMPWMEDWLEYGIDFLAGVQVSHVQALLATVAEGGGVNIFEYGVQYQVLDLSQNEMQCLKTNIADLVAKREQLKTEMDAWYGQRDVGSGKLSRFPKRHVLEQIDKELSLLDLRFKRQWDARHAVARG